MLLLLLSLDDDDEDDELPPPLAAAAAAAAASASSTLSLTSSGSCSSSLMSGSLVIRLSLIMNEAMWRVRFSKTETTDFGAADDDELLDLARMRRSLMESKRRSLAC